MGLYVKWGRKPRSFLDGLIFGIFLFLFSLFVFFYPLISMIVAKSPWYQIVLVSLMCFYFSFVLIGAGCMSICEGIETKKRKMEISEKVSSSEIKTKHNIEAPVQPVLKKKTISSADVLANIERCVSVETILHSCSNDCPFFTDCVPPPAIPLKYLQLYVRINPDSDRKQKILSGISFCSEKRISSCGVGCPFWDECEGEYVNLLFAIRKFLIENKLYEDPYL